MTTATCQNTELKTTSRVVTENTPYGPTTRTVKTTYTRKDWTNYPSEGKSCSNLDVKVWWNSQLVGGYVTGDQKQIAKVAAEAGFTF